MQRSGNSPQQILERLQVTAGAESRRVELTKIYQTYWEALDQIGYLDRRRLAYKLLEVLTDPNGQTKDSLGFFAFDGFDRFNALQLHVIDALAGCTDALLLAFDYIEPELDREAEYLWKQSSFVELQSILGPKLRRVERDENGAATRTGAPITESFSAPDRYFEMAEVASRIKRAIRTGPKELNNVLVVARSLDKYRSAVESAFQDAGIDYFMDESIQLRALPAVQFFLKICSLQLNGFLRADVIEFLRNKYFKHENFGLSENLVDELDRCSRERAVLGGEQQWQSALLNFGRDVLWQKLKVVFDLLTPPKQRGTPVEYVQWIEDTIEQLLILPSAEEFSDPFEHWEQDRALAQFKNVLALLVNEQEIVSRLSHHDQISFADFYLRLERSVERSNFQQQPRTKDYVLVCSAELAPNRRFEQVFIAGLTEGEFPRHSRGSGFVNSDEVENWRRFGIDIQNPRLNSSFEPALFKSLIQRADKRVVVSYPAVEMSGEELTPSSLLREVASLDPDQVPFVHAMEEMVSCPTSARNAVAAQFWQSPQKQLPVVFFSPNPFLDSLLKKLEEPLAMVQTRSGGGGPLNGSLVEYVRVGTVKVLVPKRFSPTSLSDYGKCPFRFWMSHILEVEPYEEAEEGLSPKLRGQIYHKALELFYNRLLAEKLSIENLTDEQLDVLLDEEGNKAISSFDERPDFHKDEFWNYRYQEIIFRLKRLLRAERVKAMEGGEVFTPRLVEVSFGFEEKASYPALKIVQGDTEVLIQGRVDRIDLAAGCELDSSARVRVVDYKSGSTSSSLDDALSGRNLQLPLYVLAVENAILPKSKVIEAEYLSVRTAMAVGKFEFEKAAADHNVQRLMGNTRTNVVNFVSGIKKGEFNVKPSHPKVCEKCDHRTVCRISELHLTQTTETDNDYGTD